MRIFATWAAILCLASPALAAGGARPACPDVLVGDSLAVGMGPYAREGGYEVLARQGVGLAWLSAQRPRCARRLIIVIGTNDLRGMTPSEAAAYAARVSMLARRWRARQVVWATPGCFSQDVSLEQSSIALDRAIAAQRRRGSGGLAVSRGRQLRCSFASNDGIHPASAGYRSWWQGLVGVAVPTPPNRNRARRAPTTSAGRGPPSRS